MKWSLRLEGSEEMDWDWASWDSIEDFKWVKRERMEEVEDSEDEESGFCERLECVWKGVPALLSASSVSPPPPPPPLLFYCFTLPNWK